MGTDAKERALVEMWQRRMELELFIPIAQVFRNEHAFFAGRIPQVREWGEVCRKHAAATMSWLDRELADREFIAGSRYTIADITALCALDFGRVSEIRIAPEQTNLKRWHDKVAARPSAKA
jgi:glutathione S-transferase